jgi:hypothetical protein
MYDKLAIIQALKSEFKNATFFTNDLHTRLAERKHLPFTRNLIVASHFGLQLAPEFQDGRDGQRIPPFRDAYQTSRYFAFRLALTSPGDPYNRLADEQIKQLVASPRIFEIGSGELVELSVDDEDPVIHPQKRAFPVHDTKVTFRLSVIKTICWWLLATTLVVVLLASVSKTVADRFRPFDAKGRKLNYALWGIILIGLILASFIAYDHYLNPAGEFWSISNGTSIWVSVVLEYLAVSVAVYLLVRGADEIRSDVEQIEEEFRLASAGESPGDESRYSRLAKYWLACTFYGLRS